VITRAGDGSPLPGGIPKWMVYDGKIILKLMINRGSPVPPFQETTIDMWHSSPLLTVYVGYVSH